LGNQIARIILPKGETTAVPQGIFNDRKLQGAHRIPKKIDAITCL
jgi:hypothetical protein